MGLFCLVEKHSGRPAGRDCITFVKRDGKFAGCAFTYEGGGYCGYCWQEGNCCPLRIGHNPDDDKTVLLFCPGNASAG